MDCFGGSVWCYVDFDDMAYEVSTPQLKAPCRCESLLRGHEQHCEHHPDHSRRLTDEEVERKRLENVWAIPRPREPLSYKTAMDHVGGNAPRHVQKTVKLAEAYGCGIAGIMKLLGDV